MTTNYTEKADHVRRQPDETLGKWIERAAEAILPHFGMSKRRNEWSRPERHRWKFFSCPLDALQYECAPMQDALMNLDHETANVLVDLYHGGGWRFELYSAPPLPDTVEFVTEDDSEGSPMLIDTIAAYWFAVEAGILS